MTLPHGINDAHGVVLQLRGRYMNIVCSTPMAFSLADSSHDIPTSFAVSSAPPVFPFFFEEAVP